MHYNVIVTAEIRQSLAAPVSLDMPAGVNNLLNELMSSKIKIVSEGTLCSTRDGRIVLTFNSEDGQKNTVSFSKKDPELISLCREETLFKNGITVFLEEGTRHKCFGKDKNGERVEFTVKTAKVDNRLLKLGKMYLDYSIEICGMRAESSQITLTVVHDTTEE